MKIMAPSKSLLSSVYTTKSSAVIRSAVLGGRQVSPSLSLQLHPPHSAIRVCHVVGDDERTGEDLVRREEAVQVPKYCV